MAAIEWRSVHEFRPRVSTSAGQSSMTVAVGVRVVDACVVAFGAFIDLAWAAHAEKALLEVHERQLYESLLAKSGREEENPASSLHTAFRQAPVRRQVVKPLSQGQAQ